MLNRNFIVADINDTKALKTITDMSFFTNKIYLIYSENKDLDFIKSILVHKNIHYISGDENTLYDHWKFLATVADENSFIVYLSSNKIARKKNYIDVI